MNYNNTKLRCFFLAKEIRKKCIKNHLEAALNGNGYFEAKAVKAYEEKPYIYFMIKF